jgi:carbon monoxide dehydrogenase subunit G
MEISTDFALPLEPTSAYELLLDLEQVAPCMPGAVLGEEREDGARQVAVAVRLGPMKFNYAGTVRIAERDEASRRAVLVGDAQEKRGQGSAKATITMTVAPGESGGSRVQSVAVFDLTGRAAQTGRGIVEDVARRMVADMAACLSAKAAAPPTPSPEPVGEAGAGGPASSTGGASTPAGPQRPVTATAPAGPPIRAGRLLLSILWDRIRRLWLRVVQLRRQRA